MSCLSVYDADGAKVAANPIFLLDGTPELRSSGSCRFEVLEADAGGLVPLIEQYRCFAIDDDIVWGKLVSLEPANSTHSAFAYLRYKPVMLGTLSIVPDLTAKASARTPYFRFPQRQC